MNRTSLLQAALLSSVFGLGLGLPARAVGASTPTGRWNVTIEYFGITRPASFLMRREPKGWVVDFQGPAGGPHTRPASFDGHRIEFSDPDQGINFTGAWDGLRFLGTIEGPADAPSMWWSAERSPVLAEKRSPVWLEPVTLFDGSGLGAWRPRQLREGPPAGWSVRDGALVADNGTDLVSTREFRDFKLHLEYAQGRNEDSGVHLRGRYEIQLRSYPTDEAGDKGATGALYGYRAPDHEVPSDEGDVFHSLDATLIGRRLSVSIDGVVLHDGVRVESITGDAIDCHEDSPGPLMLQGYLGKVRFRNIVVTPAR